MKIDRWHALKVKFKEMLACSICDVAQHQHRYFNGLMDPLCIQRSHIQRTESITHSLTHSNFCEEIRIFFHFYIHYCDLNLVFHNRKWWFTCRTPHYAKYKSTYENKCTIIYNIHGQHFYRQRISTNQKTTHTHLKRGENLPSLMVFWFNFLAICVCTAQ